MDGMIANEKPARCSERASQAFSFFVVSVLLKIEKHLGTCHSVEGISTYLRTRLSVLPGFGDTF
jgi:hypothetical protein